MPVWHPEPEDVQGVVDAQNPWHRSGIVPECLALPVERPLAQLLFKRLLDDEPHRFQVILGPRRVGKTTALYQTVRHLLDAGIDPTRIWWLRLDHPLLASQDLGTLVRHVLDVAAATAESPVYLMLDELVYTERWDLWLKTFFDDHWPVRIAATSSASAALREGRLESGVGRWTEHHLTPYLFTEYLDLVGSGHAAGHAAGHTPGLDDIDLGPTLADTIGRLPQGHRPPVDLAARRRTFMLIGGFPELITQTGDRTDHDEADLLLRSQQVLRADAVERTLYKDIPQSFGLSNPMLLERLLFVLAAQTTGLLSPSNISTELGMAQPTVDRYLSYLQRAFLVFTLANYSGNEATVQRRGRKLSFVDGAVRNAALQRGLAPLDDPTELGVLIENLAAATLWSLGLHTGTRVHHWRVGKHEVDLIHDHPTTPVAFEIGLSSRHSRDGLRALCERHPRFAGACYLVAPDVAVNHPDVAPNGIGTLPFETYLRVVGSQAQAAQAANLGVARA